MAWNYPAGLFNRRVDDGHFLSIDNLHITVQHNITPIRASNSFASGVSNIFTADSLV
jgi:hypothetical protein